MKQCCAIVSSSLKTNTSTDEQSFMLAVVMCVYCEYKSLGLVIFLIAHKGCIDLIKKSIKRLILLTITVHIIKLILFIFILILLLFKNDCFLFFYIIKCIPVMVKVNFQQQGHRDRPLIYFNCLVCIIYTHGYGEVMKLPYIL